MTWANAKDGLTWQQRQEARFWSKVAVTPSCWLWQAGKADGYGQFNLMSKQHRAHRVAYEWLVGPVPDGLHLDHLCRRRDCVNPAHLEPVTPLINAQRGERGLLRTTCHRGHALPPVVLGVPGRRRCRECDHQRDHERYWAGR